MTKRDSVFMAFSSGRGPCKPHSGGRTPSLAHPLWLRLCRVGNRTGITSCFQLGDGSGGSPDPAVGWTVGLPPGLDAGDLSVSSVARSGDLATTWSLASKIPGSYLRPVAYRALGPPGGFVDPGGDRMHRQHFSPGKHRQGWAMTSTVALPPTRMSSCREASGDQGRRSSRPE